MNDSQTFIELLKANRPVDGSTVYAYAFGMAWTMLDAKQQQALIEHVSKPMQFVGGQL